jgi:AcrR family transcriptional regulator
VKEDKKRSILDAAERCVISQGIEGVTMRAIAAEAGINLASLHYYFENKENLLTSLITQKFMDYGAAFSASLPRSDTPAQQIASAINHLKKTVLEDRSTYILLLEYLPNASRNPRIRELLRASYREFRASLKSLLDRALKEKGKSGVDTVILSSFILSLIDGMWIQLFLDEDAFDIEKYFDQINRMIEDKLA